MDRNLQIIGLAKKAGLLAVGAEDTSLAARAGKASVVVSSCDASDNAVRRARNSAETSHAIHIIVPYSSFELGNVSGRGSPGTVAILDAGLAARFMRGMAETEPERYSGAAEELAGKARVRLDTKRQTPPGKRRIVQ